MRKNYFILKAVPLFGAFVLCACNSVPAERVTYDLLWDTKLEKIESHVKLSEDSKSGIPTLYKEVDGVKKDDFKVLMFTDTHLDHKKPQCNYTYTMIAKNIMAEKPDFVAFCGDNITSIENEPRAKQFCQMLEDLNVYWSCTLGNHEGDQGDATKGQTGLTRQAMVDIFASYPHCLLDASVKHTKVGLPVYGVGNNAVNILNSKREVAQTLFFLDTEKLMSTESMAEYMNEIEDFKKMGKAKDNETEFYDYIHNTQIQWYKEVMADSKSLNSVVFSHVPLKDMEDAYISYYNTIKKDKSEWAPFKDQGVGSNENIWPYTIVPGETNNEDLGKIKLVYGVRAEDMCYGPHDLRMVDKHTPMFNAMLTDGGAAPAFFCGHDHQNNFMLKLTPKDNKTITMGYIQPACYSSNNFWSKGLLHWDPYNSETQNKYHLIQGYSVMNLTLDNPHHPFEVNNYTNYEKWNSCYNNGLDLVKDNRGEYKPAWDYEKKVSKYPNDPNDPLKAGPTSI